MNKQIDELIERLGGNEFIGKRGNITTSRIKPVLIGDVLVKIYKIEDMGKWQKAKNRLLDLWQECGISKSLQEIAESGWEEKTKIAKPYKDCFGSTITGAKVEKVLKPEVEALFSLLISLNL